MNNKEIHFDLLRKLESSPQFIQREFSRDMGLSRGKINYCMKKLTVKGWVKLTNFSHSSNKLGYMYLLTSSGVDERVRLTFSFFKRKIKENEILRDEIAKLKLDVEEISTEKL